MMTRRDFLKETATIGLTAAAAAAFWNAAPKSVEAYRDYIGERMQAGSPLPRKPKPSGASECCLQAPMPIGTAGTAWSEMIKNTYYAAGLDAATEPGDQVAIKQHFGERNRTSYLRPHFARSLVTEIRKKGGNPIFLDTTTSYYPSARYIHMNYYDTALSHGFTQETVGCPVIPWSDGFWGADDVTVTLDGNQLTEVKVAKLIGMSDTLMAFTHAKGHGSGIIGGTLKNLGIGGASAHGKFYDHCLRGQVTRTDWTPMVLEVDPFACPGTNNCEALSHPYLGGDCTRACPYKSYEVGPNGMTRWDSDSCARNKCFDGAAPSLCQRLLPGAGCAAGFINMLSYSGIGRRVRNENTGIRYTDTAVGCWWLFPEGKAGAFNIMIDIQPKCDCAQYDGINLVPDLGVLTSWDLVAIDEAFIDCVQASPSNAGSQADILGCAAGDEKFGPVNTGDPRVQCMAGERLGAGTREYSITTVEPTPWFLWGDMPFYLHDQADKVKGSKPPSEKRWNDPRAYYIFE